MQLSRLNAIAGVFLAAILSAPLWGATTPLPGTLNYIEGKAAIGTEALNSKSIGSAQLQAGESLSTNDGKAEILLTPGVFLRLDDNSTVKMISPSLTDTKVEVSQGRAMVEVDQIHKANDIRVVADNATVELLKTGLYDFDAQQNAVRVFDGEALVRTGDQQVKVKGGREVSLNTSGNLKAEKFKKKDNEGDLYRFSSLRSDYLAEANTQASQIYVNYGWWPGAGWWWNPWFGGYTFIPAGGMFYNPFGWGFYPPSFVGVIPVRPGPRPFVVHHGGFRSHRG